VTLYGWDYHNRLTSLTFQSLVNSVLTTVKTVNYTYDSSGRLIRKGVDADGDGTGGTSYTYTVYDGLGQNPYLTISDADGLDNGLVWDENGIHLADIVVTERYLYGQAADQILAVDNSPLLPGEGQGEGGVLWGLADHEGTIRDVVNNSGTVVDHRQYGSFGQLTSETDAAVDFLFGYTGQAMDRDTAHPLDSNDKGLYYYDARWYDAAVGRFLSEDPAADDVNLYRYCGNNPWNYTDPTGMYDYGGTGNVTHIDASYLDLPGMIAGDITPGIGYANSSSTFGSGSAGTTSASNSAIINTAQMLPGLANVLAMARNGASGEEINQYLAENGTGEAYVSPYDTPSIQALPAVGSFDWGLRVNANAPFDMLKIAAGQQPAYTADEHDQALAITMAPSSYAAYHTFAPVNYEPGLGGSSAAENIVIAALGGIDLFGRGQSSGRLSQDINVNPQPPSALPLNRPIGQSPSQNAQMQADIAEAQAKGASDFRVNQQQVDAAGQRVGVNRPDLQYTDASGQRVYVEYDTKDSSRGPEHEARIQANDPRGKVILKTVD
jgi:RHS repeat-associated protein